MTETTRLALALTATRDERIRRGRDAAESIACGAALLRHSAGEIPHQRERGAGDRDLAVANVEIPASSRSVGRRRDVRDAGHAQLHDVGRRGTLDAKHAGEIEKQVERKALARVERREIGGEG